jgi:hypothetical protein
VQLKKDPVLLGMVKKTMQLGNINPQHSPKAAYNNKSK